MKTIIENRIENFKATRDCFKNTPTEKIYDAKIELLEGILQEACDLRIVSRSKRESNFELFNEINSDFLQAMIDDDQGIYNPVEKFKTELEDKYIIIKKQLITAN